MEHTDRNKIRKILNATEGAYGWSEQTVEEIHALLTSERTSLIAEVEVWLDKVPIYEIDDAPPEFCAGYNECVSVWKTYVLELRAKVQEMREENEKN